MIFIGLLRSCCDVKVPLRFAVRGGAGHMPAPDSMRVVSVARSTRTDDGGRSPPAAG
ncbi:MAG: hypothetical protein QOI47_864 [Actinomycetota bacterium]|nr:hypothetical protein [Actinomycetota bacterium]